MCLLITDLFADKAAQATAQAVQTAALQSQFQSPSQQQPMLNNDSMSLSTSESEILNPSGKRVEDQCRFGRREISSGINPECASCGIIAKMTTDNLKQRVQQSLQQQQRPPPLLQPQSHSLPPPSQALSSSTTS